MSMILHSLFSLSITTISGLRSVFYFFICLDCKVPKYFTFVIFQHCLWLMREPFVFKFNLKFIAQELVYFFSRIVVSSPILVSIQDRTQTDNMDDIFNFLFADSAQLGHVLVISPMFYCISSKCLFLGSTYKAFSFPSQITCFQPLPPSLILHPLCFSQELAMQCFLFLIIIIIVIIIIIIIVNIIILL